MNIIQISFPNIILENRFFLLLDIWILWAYSQHRLQFYSKSIRPTRYLIARLIPMTTKTYGIRIFHFLLTYKHQSNKSRKEPADVVFAAGTVIPAFKVLNRKRINL